MELVASFLVSLLIAVLVVPLCIRFAPSLGLIDLPNSRKVHVSAVPRIGGLAMVLASLVTVLLATEVDQITRAYVFASLILLVFGVWDDRVELGYRTKFLGQIAAICAFVVLGDIHIRWLPLLGIDQVPYWVGVATTIVGLVGITNAVNLVDGLDGLAGGTCLISLAGVGLLAYLAGDLTLTILCLAVSGSIIGFLRYNTHPARVFMGDTGSQFLGFSAGAACLVLTQKSNTALSPAIPLLLLGLPILDTLTVMTRRLMRGHSPFKPDKTHFHHRLMNMGLLHYEAVSAIYLVQICLILFAYTYCYHSDGFLVASFLIFCLGVNFGFWLLEKHEWRVNRESKIGIARADRVGLFISQAKAALPIFMSFSLLPVLAFIFIRGAQMEGIRVLLLVIGVIGVSSFLSVFSKRKLEMLERMFWYVVCGLSVYIGQHLSLYESEFVLAYFAILTLLIIFAFGAKTHGAFQLTPFDLIVLISAFVMFYFGRGGSEFGAIAMQVTQVILFLYAVEFIVSGQTRNALLARVGISGLVLVCAVTA